MLAVAVKKRLLLFRYDGTEFVELKEVALAEAPVAAAWAGNYICCACRSMCARRAAAREQPGFWNFLFQ